MDWRYLNTRNPFFASAAPGSRTRNQKKNGSENADDHYFLVRILSSDHAAPPLLIDVSFERKAVLYFDSVFASMLEI